MFYFAGIPDYKTKWLNKIKLFWRSRINEINTTRDYFGGYHDRFDIVSFDIHDQLAPLDCFMEELAKCLKPGGCLILSHANSWSPKMDSNIFREVFMENGSPHFEKRPCYIETYQVILNLPGLGQVTYPASLTNTSIIWNLQDAYSKDTAVGKEGYPVVSVFRKK